MKTTTGLQVSPAGEYHVICPETRRVMMVTKTQREAYRIGARMEKLGVVAYGWWVNCPKEA